MKPDSRLDDLVKEGAAHRIGLTLFFGAVATFLGFTLTGGWDIWWHMLVGRVSLTEGFSALDTDIFSHTTGTAVWLHKDLLADILLYLGFNKMGFAWFAVLKGIVVLAVAYGVHKAQAAPKRRVVITILAGGLAVAAIQYRLVERPILFSLALFPLLMAILENARRKSESNTELRKAALSWLPAALLVWLWAWLHRGAMVGLALILAYAVEQWAGLLLGRRLPRLFGPNRAIGNAAVALAAFVVTAGLSIINPSGIHFYTSSFAVAGNETLRNMISDWAPIGIYDLARHFPITCVVSLLALLGVVRELLSRVKTREGKQEFGPGIMHLSLILMFGGLVILDSVRWVPQLSLFAAVTLGQLLHGMLGVLDRTLPRFIARPRGRGILLGAAMCAVIFFNSSFRFGVGPLPNKFPDGAVEYARKHSLSGNVLNSFHLGGFILWKMWPEVLVSSDGRNDLVFAPELLTLLLRSQSDPRLFERVVGRTGANWVMASNVPGHLSHRFLFRDTDWMMVYWCEAAVIYVRRGAFPRAEYPELWKDEFKIIDPSAVDVSVVRVMSEKKRNITAFKQMSKELERMLASSPDGLRANAALAVFYHFSGKERRGDRDAVLEKLEALYGHRDAVRDLKQRFKKSR